MSEPVRFGEILIGQDFRIPGSQMVLRRTQGRFAKPVKAIRGEAERYGGSEFPYDLSMEVERVEAEAQPQVERPRG
jgi:hypothetical protein